MFADLQFVCFNINLLRMIEITYKMVFIRYFYEFRIFLSRNLENALDCPAGF